MSQRDVNDRSARMREIMDKAFDDLRKEITVDDLPVVFRIDDLLPTVFPISPPQDMSPNLSPEEGELGARWGEMAKHDPLAIIPQAVDLHLAVARKKAEADAAERKAAKAAKREEMIRRLVPVVAQACAKAHRKPMGTDERAKEIRRFLPNEYARVSVRLLKKALSAARLAEIKRERRSL